MGDNFLVTGPGCCCQVHLPALQYVLLTPDCVIIIIIITLPAQADPGLCDMGPKFGLNTTQRNTPSAALIYMCLHTRQSKVHELDIPRLYGTLWAFAYLYTYHHAMFKVHARENCSSLMDICCSISEQQIYRQREHFLCCACSLACQP
jgi:hypothetical protein